MAFELREKDHRIQVFPKDFRTAFWLKVDRKVSKWLGDCEIVGALE